MADNTTNDDFFFKKADDAIFKAYAERKKLVGTTEGAVRKTGFVEIYTEDLIQGKLAQYKTGNYTRILPQIGLGINDTYSSTTGKPIPTLGAVTVEMDGDFGSLRRATAEFTCYDMDSFDELEKTLLRPGKRIFVRYGYLEPVDAKTDVCQGPIDLGNKTKAYEFVIYDYSFTYTKENYIKCSFKAVGPGVLAGSVNFGNSVDDSVTPGAIQRLFRRDFQDTTTATPVKGIEDVFDYNLVSNLIQSEKVDSIGIGKLVSVWPDDGFDKLVDPFICMMKLPKDYEVADAIQDSNWKDSTYAAYCSLSYIVHNLVNEELFKKNPTLPDKLRKIRYICNSDVTSISLYSKYIFSADPLNVGVTGVSDIQMSYGPDEADASKSFNFIWTGIMNTPEHLSVRGSKLDCSNILISRLLLRNILKNFSKDKFSINDFFSKLFDAISDATAGMITLGLFELDVNPLNEKDQALYNKYSNGGNYIPILVKPLKQKPNGVPEALEFDPLKGDGITRSCEVTAKVPKDMAAEAYGRNTPGDTGGSTGTDGGQIADVLSQKKSLINKYLPDTALKTLKENTYPENKLSGTAIEDGKAFLKDVMNKYTSIETRLSSEQILYPLEMKLTLDGIEGFRFGDHITTTNIPNVYRRGADTKAKGPRVGFTVLRTTHTIVGNNWSTELTSIARMIND